MKKVILFIILTILFVSFAAFLVNAFNLQQNYFKSKNSSSPEPLINDVLPKPAMSLFTEYSKDVYDKALDSDSILVLFFTSNWCLECSKQNTINQEIFNEMNDQGLVFLKVHILDSETTIETDALAKKFEITKENSFVILGKDGGVMYRYTGMLDSNLLKQKLQEVILK